MENNENKILVPRTKETQNNIPPKKTICSFEINKFIIFILIIITSIQFLVINILLFKGNKPETFEKTETIENIENNNNITLDLNYTINSTNRRQFLFIEDNKTNIETNKSQIHIVLSLDARSIYPTLVSMASAL